MARKITIMPTVTIPESKINLRTGEAEDQDFSMKEWLDLMINSHQAFGKGLDKIKQGLRIYRSYQDAKEEFILEEADYEELKECLKAQMQPKVARLCVPFFKAVLDAKTIEIDKMEAKEDPPKLE